MNSDFALLQVGINRYPEVPLQGCVNDCLNLSARIRQIGAKPSWYEQIFDGSATRAAILEGLRSLIGRDTSTLIFQYSGHGTRLRDRNGDETSGYDSAICPIDFVQNGIILDDELAEIYDTLPADKRLIVLFDSCYSGKAQRSITRWIKRNMGISTPRFLPESVVSPLPLPRPYKTRRKSFLENSERAVLISTSKENQTSADAYVGNEWQGAGTAALLWAWAQCGRDATYMSVAAAANWWLSNNRYPQVLRVEGRPENQTRVIFT